MTQRQRSKEIPLNGRHFVDLNLLTPGTVTPTANGFLTAPLRGQGSFAINTAGQREDTTNWLVNGINLNDPVQNQVTFQPPVATLEEFKVDNSTFPAQYGRNAGAIVNMATRSGTNEFHGEAFEFFRNNALDARNYFNVTGTPQVSWSRWPQNGNPITPLLIIGPATGSSITVRPDQLKPVSGTGNPSQFFSNAVLCEPFAGTPVGAPPIPDCATTPNAAFAVPCTFAPTPTAPGKYPIVPGRCHPGSAGRDSLPGPDFVNTDFSLLKNTKITERLNLQFRTEVFDLFNHPNFGNPTNTATSAAFGKILSTRFPVGDFGSARQIQFALKVLF
jgi:hypothetical protein